MLRLTLIPLFFIISTIVIILLAYFLLAKLGSGLNTSFNKSKDLAVKQQRKWHKYWQRRQSRKEQKEKLPAIIQKGRKQFDEIERNVEHLPGKWKIKIKPVVNQAKNILDEVTAEALIEHDAKKKSHYPNERLSSIRPFFNHSLDALLQFVKKLNSNQAYMDEPANNKALQNITAFETDLEHYHAILEKSRKLDFDILMDVINARLRQ